MSILRRIAIIPAAVAACGIAAGCFSYHKKVEETTPAPVVETAPAPAPVVVAPPATSSTTTTTTYTTTDDDHDSVVGSTAHAAGTIIAAPFRLVGDALSIVF